MTSYEEVKARAREVSALRSLVGREISPMPPVADGQRRARCARDLRQFLLTYYPRKFKKPFGKIHLRLIQEIERVAIHGGKQAVAMPRGSGKTTICAASVVWAVAFGWRRFVVVVAANTKEARKLLKAICAHFTSAAFAADFPEIAYPLQRLRGSALLARGQLFYGQPTNVVITADSMKLPTIPGSMASGATLAAYGVRAAIRGLTAENPDGSTDRPDLLFLDDLQTDAVAVNPARVAQLEETVAGALEGLAENGAELAQLQTCTVRAPDDYADRTLNREIYPRWHGLRFASLERMPARLDLWREYRSRWFDDEAAATEFYKAHLDDMRAGAVVSWPEAYSGGRLVDTLEYYMTRWCENERAFFAEQQNQPLEAASGSVKQPAKVIAARLNGYDEGVVPDDAAKITAAIDVHADVLFYSVIAWRADFTGRVIEYGTYPQQKRRYFAKSDGGLETLARVYPGSNADARLYSGLCALFADLKDRAFATAAEAADGLASRRIDRALVDSGWKPEIVENAIRAVDARLFLPAKGVAVQAKKSPMRSWPRKPGRIFGWHLIDEKTAASALRLLLVDVNYWKTKIHEAFGLTPAEAGSLSLYGADKDEHRLFAEHMAAETARLVESASNRVVEWSANINRPDNHYFDTVCYNFAAASSLGLFTADDPRRKV